MNIEKVFDFIKEKKGLDYPFLYKLINNLPFTESDLTIYGDIDFRGYNVSELPDNMVVNGRMNISYTTIDRLPNNLKVTKDLVCTGSFITKLPDNLEVWGDVFCGDTQIREIGHNIKIYGLITLWDTPITRKNDKTDINRMLEEHGCDVEGGIRM